ncbi:hypothetical protein DUNSADRAFT_10450 [Dunaliella salina]|uniref:Uncharacterized protein n=1 Tax=Dunaliella salina TaxID=3046 RepID=A0ABQ7GFA8_DUNSA|nr:hypothetical protein DUNSADRAFT_10450 [Dunaliella salina]|eukprot:KAF5833285.1 hypothetical protein DUNSADRAFT_10450 [Dunaliella salina]
MARGAIKSPPFTLPQHPAASAPSSTNGQYPAATAHPSKGLPQEAALPEAQSPVRLAVFLSGPPDYGTASLRTLTTEASSAQAVGATSESGKAQGTASELHQQQKQQQQQQQQQQQDGQAQAAPELGNPRDAWLSQVDPQATSFYKQAAVAAAALGCCCDVYAVSSCAVS